MQSVNYSNWNSHALLTCEQMRAAEQNMFSRGMESFELMRQAGKAVAEVIRKKFKPCGVLVLCGPGNNGGDGFVIAKLLHRAGWDVSVAAMKMPKELSGDAARAAKEWKGRTVPLNEAKFDGIGLIVDALFGTGLTRPLEGDVAVIIEKANASKIAILAVDLPSGINGDTGAVMGTAIKGTLTVTFFRKKVGHVLLPGAIHCGNVIIDNFGISSDTLDEIEPLTTENSKDLWIDKFPFPQPESHKYARGHALIAGGAIMTGATRLAARATQRMGAGLVTLASPQSAVPIYSTALESVIVLPCDDLKTWKELLADSKRNAILIGPGLGIGETQAEFALAALETKKSCVLDADVLGNFSDHADEFFKHLHDRCILTPHEGEFMRLFGKRIDANTDKLSRARKAAEIAGCTVLLKGADTVIAAPDGHAIVNTDAPPWLATAGAGDVLSGLILGLVAQNMSAFLSAAAAAWVHGQAAADFGAGLIAEDLVNNIPAVLRALPEATKGV